MYKLNTAIYYQKAHSKQNKQAQANEQKNGKEK